MIVDTISALSLASEVATDELLRKPVDRYGRRKPLVTAEIFENVCKQAIFQSAILVSILYWGPGMFQTEDARFLTLDSPPSQHYTIIFNTFAFMLLFNEINCRRTDGDRNVFRLLSRNKMFCILWMIAAVLQVNILLTDL